MDDSNACGIENDVYHFAPCIDIDNANVALLSNGAIVGIILGLLILTLVIAYYCFYKPHVEAHLELGSNSQALLKA